MGGFQPLLLLAGLTTLSLCVHAQAPTEKFPFTKPLSPAEAQSKFQVDDGLKIELVAAEPMVQSPAAIAWDESSRLFVAENPGYPTGPAPGKAPVGAIVELRDKNGDGLSDERVEFATGLSFPNGLMPWRNGWLVTDAPDLLWLCDTNSDGKADVREVWFTGFATNQTTQLRACYPTLGPDGWIYISRGWNGGVVTSPKWTNLPPVDLKNGDFRFRPNGSGAEAIGGNAQFGMVFDDVGRRFLTSNRNPIMHAVAWPHWWKRMPGFFFNEIVQDVSPVGAEAKVFPLSADLTTSGFMPELMSTPHAGTFTSACGLHQYFGEGLPAEYQGNWFICEPAQNLVQRQIMEPHGPSFRSRRAIEGREFLASSDTWFHPVYAATGPDGALYIADMYRKFIDHPDYLPKDARERIDFDSGKQMGRIWRISGKDHKWISYTLPKMSPPDLLGLKGLASENKWKRETAHGYVLEQQEARHVEQLIRILHLTLPKRSGDEMKAFQTKADARTETDNAPLSNYKARAINLIADAVIARQMKLSPGSMNLIFQILVEYSFDPSPSVREAAFRIYQLKSDSRNPLPDVHGEILRLWAEDPSAAVRFHMAYSLGHGDYARMTEALINILRKDVANRWTRAVVLSGLKERMNEFAEKWFADKWTELPGEPVHPIGFDDKVEGMLDLAYEMGLVYGAPSADGGSVLWHRALDEKADGTAWQAALLTGWSTAARQSPGLRGDDVAPLLQLARSKGASEKLANIEERLRFISSNNAKVVSDAGKSLSHRVAAARLLGELPSPGAREALMKVLQPATPRELQLAAARALGRSVDEKVAAEIIKRERWGSFSPEVRETFLNTLLAKPSLDKVILKAVEAQEIPAWSINPNRRRSLQQNNDPELKQLAERVFGNVGGEGRIKIYNEYKSVLRLKGNGKNGQEVFTKTCASCHTFEGKGTKVGPDLTGVKNQPSEVLLYHILVPDAEIYPGFQNYEVETTSGESQSGLLISETESNITLQRALGEKDQIPRDKIASLRTTNSSLMPNELEKTMSKQDMADLVAFLKGL